MPLLRRVRLAAILLVAFGQLLAASSLAGGAGGEKEQLHGGGASAKGKRVGVVPDPAVHIFFYAWFGNPQNPWGEAKHNMGNWREWNQEVQSHW
ncbi:hypothetical protein T484DRAFT_1818286 [Baffinella frigidus]|nr:hypothetical protein T484DRAFT_1818286 [Cryptophyta sp. CCMP2293]